MIKRVPLLMCVLLVAGQPTVMASTHAWVQCGSLYSDDPREAACAESHPFLISVGNANSEATHGSLKVAAISSTAVSESATGATAITRAGAGFGDSFVIHGGDRDGQVGYATAYMYFEFEGLGRIALTADGYPSSSLLYFGAFLSFYGASTSFVEASVTQDARFTAPPNNYTLTWESYINTNGHLASFWPEPDSMPFEFYPVGVIPLEFEFIFGRPMQFSMEMSVQTDARGFGALASIDASRSLYWGGIDAIRASDGLVLATISSDSGTNWMASQIPSQVPEFPASGMMLIGLAGLFVRGRFIQHSVVASDA